ncbi:MAG: hypothetical protein IPN72_11555 [Saprospiraceae bacterium]|nr:hypothetical protein [Saprospiraceae bacterium]
MQVAYKTELTQTLKLAIPIIVAQVGVVLMGITDTMMIGSMLGKTALGVAGFPIHWPFSLLRLQQVVCMWSIH